MIEKRSKTVEGSLSTDELKLGVLLVRPKPGVIGLMVKKRGTKSS